MIYHCEIYFTLILVHLLLSVMTQNSVSSCFADDVTSMAFMHYYINASLSLDTADLLTRVDCFDWTDVCGKVNITTYPVVRVYRKGKEHLTYSGVLDTDSVVSTMKM